MADGVLSRSGMGRPDHYLDLVDLYSARAIRARTVDARDVRSTPVHAVGRGAMTAAINQRSSKLGQHSRKWKLASVATVLMIAFSVFAGTAFAEQQYLVQEGDTIHSIADLFGIDAIGIVEANDLQDVAYLYPGQQLILPGIGGRIESGFVVGVYEVVAGDTIGAIAWTLHVSTADLLSVNGLTEDEIIVPGQILIIPQGTATQKETLEQLAVLNPGESGDEATEADIAAQAESGGLPSSASIWVPTYYQARNLSCEYAATYIATSAFGYGITEDVFWNQIPITANPHYGYRGNIDGWWGNTVDYGIYPEALAPILNANGFGAEVFYGDSDPSYLMQQLAWGRPVVVWLAMWGDTGIVYDDEGTYTVFAGEHVMTAYGYDESGVLLSDPASGSYTWLDWGTFLWMWGASDGMSMAVYPY